jgi:hypothetical protein
VDQSLSALSKWNLKANSTKQTLLGKVSAGSGLVSQFIRYVSPTQVTTYGSCSDWNGFVHHSVAKQLASLSVSTISLGYMSQLTDSFSSHVVTCSDQTVASNVLKRLAGFVDSSYSGVCRGRRWAVAACSSTSSVAVCLNCTDPCAARSENNTLAPCSSTATPGPAIQYMVVQFEEPEVAPAIVDVAVTSAKSSLKLAVTVESQATVYCRAYDKSSPKTAPGSNTEITQFGSRATTSSTNVSAIVLSGLSAATSYNLYCLTVTTDGTKTAFTDVASKVWTAKTSCCRNVLLTLLSSTVKENAGTAQFLSVTLDAAPSALLTVNVTVKSTSNATSQAVVPGSVRFSSGVISTTLLGLQGLSTGTYTVVASLDGAAAGDFSTVCTAGCSFTVIAVSAPTPAPSLSSAQFSSDGSKMTITFSAATNRAQMTGTAQFTCSRLFAFSGSNQTKCQWSADATTVTAAVSGSWSWALVPGSKVTYTGQSFLAAICTATNGNCTNWPRVAATVLTVTAPSSAMIPTVAVSGPESIGQCDSLYLDLSASTGSGGRSWVSKSITVAGSNGNVTALQSFLTNRYLASSVPTAIPSGLMQAGSTYTFTVTLCNFVGGCGQTKKTVSMLAGSAPLVAVIGPSVRSMHRNSSLSLTSNAFVSGCNGGIVTEGLSYQWSLAPTVVSGSVSKDPSVLLLNSYVLSSNSIYTVTLTVTIASTGVYSSTSVQVLVLTGDIIPVLPGGSSRSVRTLSSILLDASKSVDTDVAGGLVGTAAGLKFSWSCVQTTPTISSSCILQTNGTSILLAYAPASAANTSSTMTLLLRDSTGTRSAQTRVTVSVVTPVTPIVTISNSSTGKVNPGTKLLLVGVVSLASSSTQLVGTASWSVDSSAVDLTSTALVSTSASLASSSTAATSTTVPLLLSANSVPAGSVLTFTLAASAGAASSSATITITVNSPPTPGTLTISPSSGVAMTDSFTFLASLWVDSDTPLSYQFGYIASATGTVMIMQSQSEMNFGTTLLPAGSGSGSALTCVGEVFDSYQANTTVYSSVQVTSSGASLSSALSSISSQLSGSLGSVNGIKKLVALSVSVLTQVNCTAVGNCTALNRASCQAVSNMCGPCLSGFYGSSGVGNSLCLSYSAAQSLLQSSFTDDKLSCSSASSVCPAGYKCNTSKKCEVPSKTCLNDCSGHGECIFVQSATDSEVSECTIYDPSCKSECTCESDWYGDDCSLSSHDLSARQSAKETIASKVVALTSLENPSQSVVSGWMASLAGVTTYASDLTNGSITSIQFITDFVIEAAGSVGMSVESTATLMDAIDCTTSAISASTSNRRRLHGRKLGATNSSVNAASVVASTESLLAKYGAFITNSLVDGESGFTTVQNTYRMSSKLQSSDSSVSLPLSELEGLNGVVTSSASLSDETVSAGSVAMTMFSLSSALYANSAFNSAPVSLQVTSSSCNSDTDTCAVTITLQNTASVTYTDEAPVMFTTRCAHYDYTVHSYVCPDQSVATATCNGTASVIVTHCPHKTSLPSCASVNSDLSYEADACTVVSYTSSQVVCSCTLSDWTSRRRLVASSFDDYSTSSSSSAPPTANVEVVAVAQTLSEGMLQTWMSAKDLDVSSLRRGWWVLMTIGCFFGAVVSGLYFAHRADSYAKTVKPSGKHLTDNKADLKSQLGLSRNSFRISKRNARAASTTDRGLSSHMTNIALDLEQSLPQILRRKPFTEKFMAELKRYHRWFGIIFYYSEDFPRILRIISLVGNVVSMLFVQAVTYNMTNPDDGSCGKLYTEQSCLEPRSPYAADQSKCYWNPLRGYGSDLSGLGTCHFMEPANDLKVVLFVAIFAALLSTPFSFATDWIVMNVLSAKTAVSSSSSTELTNEKGPISPVRQGGANNLGGMFRSQRLAAILPMLRSASSKSGKQQTGLDRSMELSTTLEADFSTLVQKIKSYRETLTPAQLKEFDGG